MTEVTCGTCGHQCESGLPNRCAFIGCDCVNPKHQPAPQARVFKGRDPGNTDVQMLIEVWPDGATIAYRESEFESWGPPHDLEEVE